MGRAGRSGSGRSSGMGGGRSSGGRSSSGGRAGRGSSGSFGGRSRGGGSFGGGFSSPPRPPHPPRPPRPPHFGGYYSRPPRRYYGGNSGGNSGGHSGCSLILTAIIVLAIVVVVIGRPIMDIFNIGNSAITKSTIDRKPLESGMVTETDYYEDNLNWIQSSSKLEKGMVNFYKRTGVQPYLYITDEINGKNNPSNSDFETFANNFYDERFNDEGHLLVIFLEYNGNYNMWYIAGTAAKSVMDDEAIDILFDNIEYYYQSDLTDEEMFSTAFDKASQRIMKKEISIWVIVLVLVAVISAIWVVYKLIKNRNKRKQEELNTMEEILEKPLESFGSDGEELSDLEDKYKN